MSEIAIVVVVNVRDDWADPHHVAQALVEMQLSGDPRGISLPLKLELDHPSGTMVGFVKSVSTIGAAFQKGTVRAEVTR